MRMLLERAVNKLAADNDKNKPFKSDNFKSCVGKISQLNASGKATTVTTQNTVENDITLNQAHETIHYKLLLYIGYFLRK